MSPWMWKKMKELEGAMRDEAIVLNEDQWDWLMDYMNREITDEEKEERRLRAERDAEALKRVRPLSELLAKRIINGTQR